MRESFFLNMMRPRTSNSHCKLAKAYRKQQQATTSNNNNKQSITGSRRGQGYSIGRPQTPACARKEKGTGREVRDLSNAPAFVGRGSFFLNMMRPRASKSHCKLAKAYRKQQQQQQQQASKEHIACSEARIMVSDDHKPGLVPAGAVSYTHLTLPTTPYV